MAWWQENLPWPGNSIESAAAFLLSVFSLAEGSSHTPRSPVNGAPHSWSACATRRKRLVLTQVLEGILSARSVM